MPTFSGQIKDNQIVLISAISISGDSQSKPNTYQSLLDTGAQATLVSKKVVTDVGLSAIGDSYITPVSGEPIRTDKYMVRIDIPISSGVALPGGRVGTETVLRGRDIEVALLPYQPESYDVLLGMDFLSAFHFTMYGSIFILSS